MDETLIQSIERLGSLGLLGWLLVWATGTAWPKLASHLDLVTSRLDRIGDQLTALHDDISALHQRVGEGLVPSRSVEDTSGVPATTAGGRKGLPYAKRSATTGSGL